MPRSDPFGALGISVKILRIESSFEYIQSAAHLGGAFFMEAVIFIPSPSFKRVEKILLFTFLLPLKNNHLPGFLTLVGSFEKIKKNILYQL